MTKVHASLNAMNAALGDKPWCSGNHYSLADIALGCVTGYLDFRFPDVNWRDGHRHLARHHDKLVARPSFIDTAPPTT